MYYILYNTFFLWNLIFTCVLVAGCVALLVSDGDLPKWLNILWKAYAIIIVLVLLVGKINLMRTKPTTYSDLLVSITLPSGGQYYAYTMDNQVVRKEFDENVVVKRTDSRNSFMEVTVDRAYSWLFFEESSPTVTVYLNNNDMEIFTGKVSQVVTL